MTILEDLKSHGWHLSSEGFDLCSENVDKVTTSAVIKKALDMDLREIGESFLPEDLTKGKIDNLSGPGVVQIQKIKNASAPKYEYGSGAPPLLRLLLTDGNSYVTCLQWGHWKNVTMDTPPGTKLYLKPGKMNMQNNFLLLNESQFTVLGGCVANMVEKWELCRQLASHIRTKENLDGTGPPPWIPFGRPIVGVKPTSKSGHFKSLEAEVKDAKEDAVFKQQRQANIAEVARVKEAKAKSFGGRKEKPSLPKPESYIHTSYSQSNDYIDENESKKPIDFSGQDSPQRNRLFQNNRGRKAPRNEYPPPNARSNQINASNSFQSKDNKLENRSKLALGDFITSNVKQHSSPAATFQVRSADPKPQYNRVQQAFSNKDSNFEKRQPPAKYDPSVIQLANVMEQVKIYGYDTRDNRNAADTSLKPGMEVMAKYWEDNRYYRAVIHAVGKEGKTCVVHFLDYGNYEEVLINDVKGINDDRNWNAGPIMFQPAPRGNYENYPSLHSQNSGNRTSNAAVKGHYGRPDAPTRGVRTEFRPSAKIYQPPNAHS